LANRRSTNLSGLLRELREQQGSSLRTAASELGVDPSYLSRLERGEKPSSEQVLRRAAQLYDVPEEMLALAEGRLPDDIVDLFRANPQLIDELRGRFGSE
jgi:transcriptional regulator with XRE-family HTH domain